MLAEWEAVKSVVNKYKRVREAQRITSMSPNELLLEVLKMSRTIDDNISEMKNTQKTVGILLFKLGQSVARGGVSHKDSDLRSPTRFSSGLNFSAAENSEESSEFN